MPIDLEDFAELIPDDISTFDAGEFKTKVRNLLIKEFDLSRKISSISSKDEELRAKFAAHVDGLLKNPVAQLEESLKELQSEQPLSVDEKKSLLKGKERKPIIKAFLSCWKYISGFLGREGGLLGPSKPLIEQLQEVTAKVEKMSPAQFSALGKLRAAERSGKKEGTLSSIAKGVQKRTAQEKRSGKKEGAAKGAQKRTPQQIKGYKRRVTEQEERAQEGREKYVASKFQKAFRNRTNAPEIVAAKEELETKRAEVKDKAATQELENKRQEKEEKRKVRAQEAKKREAERKEPAQRDKAIAEASAELEAVKAQKQQSDQSIAEAAEKLKTVEEQKQKYDNSGMFNWSGQKKVTQEDVGNAQSKLAALEAERKEAVDNAQSKLAALEAERDEAKRQAGEKQATIEAAAKRDSAATTIQALARGFKARKAAAAKKTEQSEAAAKIQKAFRKHKDPKIAAAKKELEKRKAEKIAKSEGPSLKAARALIAKEREEKKARLAEAEPHKKPTTKKEKQQAEKAALRKAEEEEKRQIEKTEAAKKEKIEAEKKAKKEKERQQAEKRDAATKIQALARGVRDRKVAAVEKERVIKRKEETRKLREETETAIEERGAAKEQRKQAIAEATEKLGEMEQQKTAFDSSYLGRLRHTKVTKEDIDAATKGLKALKEEALSKKVTPGQSADYSHPKRTPGSFEQRFAKDDNERGRGGGPRMS